MVQKLGGGPAPKRNKNQSGFADALQRGPAQGPTDSVQRGPAQGASTQGLFGKDPMKKVKNAASGAVGGNVALGSGGSGAALGAALGGDKLSEAGGWLKDRLKSPSAKKANSGGIDAASGRMISKGDALADERRGIQPTFGDASVGQTATPIAQQIEGQNSMEAAQFDRTKAYEGAEIDRSNISQVQGDARQQQLAFTQALQNQMAGTGPSLAQNQLRETTDRGISQQMALAASGGRQGGAASQRQALRGQAALHQDASRQAGQMRIQEQLAAQGQLGGALQGLRGQDIGVRGQDIGLATGQAGLDQQAGLAGAALTSQESQALANLRQQASMKNLDAEQQTALANLEARQQAEMGRAGYAQQGIMANAGFAHDRGMAGGQADADWRASLLGAEMGLDKNLAGIASSRYGADSAAATAGNTAAQGQLGAGMGAIATGLGAFAALSDKNQKENIQKESGDIKGFLDALQGYSYNYKDGDAPGGSGDMSPQYGIMAQDLEKSKVGETFVEDTPTGKTVDTRMGFGAALAALGNLNDRLKKLED